MTGWKCGGCGYTSRTKADVVKHIKREHQSAISRTAGLGGFIYRPVKVK